MIVFNRIDKMHLNKTESKTENIVFRHFENDKLKDKIIMEFRT